MVARAMCVMYYGRSCAWNGNKETRPDVAQKQDGNYRSVQGRVTVNCKLFNDFNRTCINGIHIAQSTQSCIRSVTHCPLNDLCNGTFLAYMYMYV